MSDLKEFWDSKRQKGAYFTRGENAPLIRKELGLFFWEREGKKFVEFNHSLTFETLVDRAKCYISGLNDEAIYARDFLDCLACLGEDKVKELIKGVN